MTFETVTVEVNGYPLQLSAQRAAFDPQLKSLFIADAHFGKDAVFRAHGLPVPAGATADDLARLDALIAAHARCRDGDGTVAARAVGVVPLPAGDRRRVRARGPRASRLCDREPRGFRARALLPPCRAMRCAACVRRVHGRFRRQPVRRRCGDLCGRAEPRDRGARALIEASRIRRAPGASYRATCLRVLTASRAAPGQTVRTLNVRIVTGGRFIMPKVNGS